MKGFRDARALRQYQDCRWDNGPAVNSRDTQSTAYPKSGVEFLPASAYQPHQLLISAQWSNR